MTQAMTVSEAIVSWAEMAGYKTQQGTQRSDGRVEFNLHMSGTHSGALSLPELGVEDIPATGRRVEFPPQSDVFEVRDGKVVGGESTIPPGGGIPGLLEQLGHPIAERER